MLKLKKLSGSDVIKILEKFGFQVYNQRGSHKMSSLKSYIEIYNPSIAEVRSLKSEVPSARLHRSKTIVR